MTDYTELVKALRYCSRSEVIACRQCEYYGKEWPIGCEEALMHDAAAAIEALQAQLPKRGKWIVHTEVKNIYGGICVECPVCGDHFVVLNVSDEKYCRSCGARMTEVQDETEIQG